MKRFLLLGVCIPLFIFSGNSQERVAPNIIIILADDLGYGDMSLYGGDVPVPALTQMAKEGMRFTDFHSNGAVCSPTRAALLTGRYQHRMGIEKALAESDKGLGDEKAKGEVTSAQYLQQLGYKTALLGKWHLGSSKGMSPLQYGFDEFKGMLHGSGDYLSKVTRGGDYDWWNGDQPKKETEYNTHLITREAISFLEKNRSNPFFLFVSHNAIHFPWQQPGDTAHMREGKSYPEVTGPNSKLGQYGPTEVRGVIRNMIIELDKSVASIFSKLKELGLDENTFVFFCSDNGGIENYTGGYHNISYNKPYRGEKGQVYEGGHRVPAIAWWPQQIPASVTSNETLMTMDILPTILDMVRHKTIRNKVDGTSMAPVLFENAPMQARYLFWKHRESYAVRSGKWKMILKEESRLPELYDLSADPSEKNNIAAANQEIITHLTRELEQWKKDIYQPK